MTGKLAEGDEVQVFWPAHREDSIRAGTVAKSGTKYAEVTWGDTVLGAPIQRTAEVYLSSRRTAGCGDVYDGTLTSGYNGMASEAVRVVKPAGSPVDTVPALRPVRGMRFVHARHLAPEGTKAHPVYEVCVVTAVRSGRVYYRHERSESTRSAWYAPADRFHEEVREVLEVNTAAGRQPGTDNFEALERDQVQMRRDLADKLSRGGPRARERAGELRDLANRMEAMIGTRNNQEVREVLDSD